MGTVETQEYNIIHNGQETLTPSRLCHLCLDSEAQDVTVLVPDSEATSEEEVEDFRIFFRSCRCINSPFARPRFSVEGVVAMAAEASEAEDGCVPRVAVVGKEVS